MGPSGSGKTTLLKKILRLLPVERGTIWWKGQDITGLKRNDYFQNLAYIPQNPEHLFLEDTVAEELALSSENREEALHLARLFALEHRLKAHPFKLSEGEKRRLTLCIALAMKRPLIIMDEPTYGLDRQGRHRLLDYLQIPELSSVSMLLVSHDSPFVRALGCRTLLLTEGHVEEIHL
jgi:energy-coupling factor transport system ATP-binding protein